MIKLYALKSPENKLVVIEDKFIVLPQEQESLYLLNQFLEDNQDILKGCTIIKLEEVKNE